MTAKRRDTHTRTTTQVRFPEDIHVALRQAADERDVSVNWLVVKAVQEFLPRLIPPDEIQWAYPREPGPEVRTLAGQLVMPTTTDPNQAVARTPLPPIEPG